MTRITITDEHSINVIRGLQNVDLTDVGICYWWLEARRHDHYKDLLLKTCRHNQIHVVLDVAGLSPIFV